MAARPHHQPSFHFHVGLCLCCSKFSSGIARHLRNCLLSWISRHGPALVRCLLMTMRGPNMTMSFVTLLVKSPMPQDISTGHSFMCECVCVCVRLLASRDLVAMPRELPRHHLCGREYTAVGMAAGSLSSPCTWPVLNIVCMRVSGIYFRAEATAVILVLAARRGGMAFPSEPYSSPSQAARQFVASFLR